LLLLPLRNSAHTHHPNTHHPPTHTHTYTPTHTHTRACAGVCALPGRAEGGCAPLCDQRPAGRHERDAAPPGCVLPQGVCGVVRATRMVRGCGHTTATWLYFGGGGRGGGRHQHLRVSAPAAPDQTLLDEPTCMLTHHMLNTHAHTHTQRTHAHTHARTHTPPPNPVTHGNTTPRTRTCRSACSTSSCTCSTTSRWRA
jgi:hypothetical protein